MKGRSPTFTQIPLDIVGSTKFGRYPKISVEQTFNMIISDDFLVPFAGHELAIPLLTKAQGRAIYTSNRYNHMIAVIANNVYAIANNLAVARIGQIETFIGDVYIDENNNSQIAISDNHNLYVFNYSTNVFAKVSLTFTPGYITYQNGRIIAAVIGTSTWQLSAVGDATTWPSQNVGTLQTKPDLVTAVQRFPGRGNLLCVMGNTVTELWQDIGSAIFPYQRNSSVNIDYGCLNPATIAFNENIICGLFANEKSGPFIAYFTGGDINKISTDGIDFKLSQLKKPQDSYGFFFRQDGHLIYQISFPTDNLTYIYDFNTKKFFSLCDEHQNIHIAKRIAFFNDEYYFVSFIDGNIYNISTQFTTYNGIEIPRVRICRNIRLPDASRFVVNNLTFTIEQGTQDNVFRTEDLLTESGMIIMAEDGEDIEVSSGGMTLVTFEPLEAEDDTILLTESGQEILISIVSHIEQPVPQSVDLSVSKNGGESFGTIWSKQLNTRGNFRNRLIYWNLGAANDFVPQFRFWGLSRFVATDGIASIYQ